MASSNTETVGKPLPGDGGFEGCVAFFEGDPNVDDPEALCGFLEQEGKEALADPNADELLTSLGVEFVSAVDKPAQDSEWLIAKNAEDPRGDRHRWKTEVPLFVEKSIGDDRSKTNGDRQIAFAPVLVPGEADKHGDVIPDYEIEKAAHGYLANHRKVDADHDLWEGKGTPVESWTLKADMSFTKPDGTESRTYPKGTWILGIKFDDETWSRLKSGELTGLSMYGGAKPIDVDALRDVLGLSKSASGEDDQTDTQTMTNDDTDDDGADADGGDDTDNVTKQEVNAETVSAVLETFGDKVDNGLSPDASVEDFVMRLIEDGDVDEQSITGLSVLLNGGGGGDDGAPDEGGDGDEGDDGMPAAADEDGADISMQKNEDGGDDAATDDGSTDADVAADGGDAGSTLPDDTPDWAKSLSKDIRGSVDDVRGDVEALSDRVDDLEKEVKPENLNERLDDNADLDKRFKSYLGFDDDVDDDVVRKALREQVEKSAGDGSIDEDYSGLVDDDEEVAKGAGQSADANIRMRSDGD